MPDPNMMGLQMLECLLPAFYFLLLVIFCIERSLFVVVIEHDSMLPTLRPGERVVAFRYWPHRWLSRGDVVVFRHPHPAAGMEHHLLIKRIAGLSGDVVNVRSLINKSKIASRRALMEIDAVDYQARKHVVPPGEYFVCGDNLPNSSDSRDWGTLPGEFIEGIVLMRAGHYLSKD